MTDFETLQTLLKKCPHTSFRIKDELYDGVRGGGHVNTAKVIAVHSGARCHFEAEFDRDGNILSIGQWEDL